jgi:hypothetical protein
LKHCGSDQYVGQSSKSKGQSEKLESSQSEYEDVSDDSFEDFDSIETGNQFSVLSSDSSDHLATNEKENTSVAMETGTPEKSKVKFYRNESEFEDSDTSRDHESPGKSSLKNEVVKENGVAIDTVRRFSGLDKAAVIGINPYVNEEHADFKKFLLSLATRAKDNLVIITTSDNIKQQLDKFV